MSDRDWRPLVPGDVYLVRNDVLVFTDRPRDSQGKHRVIVVGRDDELASSTLPMVKVVPCTTSPRLGDSFLEVPIPDGEPGFTATGVYAITYLDQPVHRGDLEQHVGTIKPETLNGITAAIVYRLGTPGVD